jgi:ATP-binding protein involved in chromosome partitioning
MALQARLAQQRALEEKARKNLSMFKYRIIVTSGKGGVGKSLVSAMLAYALAEAGKSIAIFDADLYGSSIPQLLGIQNARLSVDEEGNIIPVEGPLGIRVVAMNLILDSPESPVIWRGPLASRAIIELFASVKWGSGDYLVVDMPPGTGDIPLTVAQLMPKENTYAVIVTAPNLLSETIVAKAINFVLRLGINVLGIVENMSYFKCPYCGKETSIMGKFGGEYLASRYGTQVLVKIPLDPIVNEAIDTNNPYEALKNSEVMKAFRALAKKVIELVETHQQQGSASSGDK